MNDTINGEYAFQTSYDDEVVLFKICLNNVAVNNTPLQFVSRGE